jgi:hypothetical protein
MRAAPPEQRPYSCRLLDAAERKCAFGACDARACVNSVCATAVGRERGEESYSRLLIKAQIVVIPGPERSEGTRNP